jgi:hypothetical protein
VLQSLDVLVGDGVQLLRTEERHEMGVQDRRLAGDPARLLSVRTGITVEESLGEPFECGHLLSAFRHAANHQLAFPHFAPPHGTTP